MTIGLVGRKLGMTRIFSEDGVSTPVTVLEVEANRIAQVKTVDNDGYSALQVTTGSKKANRTNKPTVVLSVGIFQCKMQLMVTHYLTVQTVR